MKKILFGFILMSCVHAQDYAGGEFVSQRRIDLEKELNSLRIEINVLREGIDYRTRKEKEVLCNLVELKIDSGESLVDPGTAEKTCPELFVSQIDTLDIAKYICDHEGFSSTPFPDLGGRGSVIGCGIDAGSMSYISEHSSLLVVEREVIRLMEKVTEKYGVLSHDKATAIVSILYSTPIEQAVIADDSVVDWFLSGDRASLETFFERQIRGVEKYSGVRLNGLRTRRAEELSLFFGK